MLKSHLFLRQQEQEPKAEPKAWTEIMAVQLSTTLLLWAVNTAAPNKAFEGACMKMQGRTLTRITHCLPGKLSQRCYQGKSSGSTAKWTSPLQLPICQAVLTTKASTPSCQEGTSHHCCLTGQCPLNVTTALAWPGIMKAQDRGGEDGISQKRMAHHCFSIYHTALLVGGRLW